MTLPTGIRPADIFAPVADRPFAQLLDWQGSDDVAYILLDPAETLTITLGELDPAARGDAFRRLDAALQAWKQAHSYEPGETPVPFAGGAAGFFAYELAHDLERLPHPKGMDQETPVLTVGFYDAVLACPNGADHAFVLSPWDSPVTQERRAALKALVEQASKARPPATSPCGDPQPTIGRDAYRASVARVIELIHAGDIFQANLAQRFDSSLPADVTPFDIYQRLAGDAPAPFAAHISLPDRTLVSSSPERFLKITPDGHVRTEPIKGTRPRGETDARDKALAEELMNSAKDRAENIMIVDLQRNDLSRTCADHSVKVDALCELHSFENVHHLISTITGTLRPDASSLDCMAACFPGGSITGAPKVRAMEIIAEEEPHSRGAYCGSIGFIGLDGAIDTSIAIRTLTIADRKITYHAGGGIVADSDPHDEYDETITKASAMKAALMGGTSS
ncbi:aminodeoxychorismate synthase component I [Pyruvatibacter sp.]|uniref:aminodeoxychorismate synthase component I n=1 Tax=Pyruvatibacter sp. TaxID=1981328 RepID=UPI00326440F1